MAIGLTLIFGILKIVNFAHGEFYMVGAYAYILISTALGLDISSRSCCNRYRHWLGY
jgi:branched-chain amino acid transport system permease protein